MKPYVGLTESHRSMDDILRFVLVREGVDELKFRGLNESAKKQISNEMIASMINSIKGKMSGLDYSLIENTKGDISRLDGYKDLEGSINLLSAMARREKDAPDNIPELGKCLDNLQKYKRGFEEGFRQNNEMIQLVYVNIVVALVNATSCLIATTVDYVKDSMGIYKAAFKKNSTKEINLYFSNIRKFNGYCVKGQLDNFFNTVLSQQNSLTLTAGVVVGAIGAIWLFVWLVREIVYLHFYSRSALAAYLKHQAEFVKLNASTLGGDMKGVRQRQEGVANKLLALSDRIAVEQKIGNKQASAQIQKETQSVDIRSVSDESNFL